jgi:hypothetical protein
MSVPATSSIPPAGGPKSIWSGLVTISVEKYRRESVLLTATFLIMFIFEICCAVVTVFDYSGPNGVSVSITHTQIALCPGGTSPCTSAPLGSRLCAPMSQRVQTAGSFAIFGIFVCLLGLALAAAECSGRVIVRWGTHILAAVFWFTVFIQWILDAAAFNENLCSNNSLKNLGFVYKAGFALAFVGWLMLSAVFVYYLCRRKIDPVKEFGHYEPTPAPLPRVRQL